MDVIAFDTETYYKKKHCSVADLGPWAYTHHPDYYCYMISVFDGTESWVGEPKDFNFDALNGAHLLSHNAHFDRTVAETEIEKGNWPAFKPAQWDCTANMTACLCNRRSLADAALFLYGEEVDKSARGGMDGIHWKDVRGTPQGDEFLKYADGDARYSWRFFNTHGHLWSEFERRLSRLTIDQSMRGVQIDVSKLESYIERARKLVFELMQRIPWVGEGEKPSSTKQIAVACRAAGIPCPPVKSRMGQEAYDDWETLYTGKHAWIGAVAQWRSLNKFLGMLETIQERLSPEGIFRFGQYYFGAHTGRWSGEGGFNMQNMKKVPILVDKTRAIRTDVLSENEFGKCVDDGLPMPEWLDEYFDIRSLFIARPGHKLVMCDLSQIEPRCLAWIAGQEKKLQKIREGYGVYEAAAVATGVYDGPKGGFKKMKAEYAAQKAKELGLGYGCGWEKYITVGLTLANYDVCKLDPVDPVTGKQIYGFTARKQVSEWRRQNPEVAGKKDPEFEGSISGIWQQLDTAFHNSVGTDFTIQLPSGRTLVYRNVQRKPKKKVVKIYNEETGELIGTKTRDGWAYTCSIDSYGRTETYGGKLTENTCQAIGRDVFGQHCLDITDYFEAIADELEARKLHAFVLWGCHDEAVCEVPVDFDGKIIEKMMSVTPSWLPGCPIGSEAKEALCYQK